MSPESARPRHGGRVDAGVPPLAELGAGVGVALRERLDDAEHVVDLVPRRVAQLADGDVQRGRERTTQPLVGAGLELAGAPVGPHRGRAQGVEQDGLAHAPQPGEDDGPLGSTPGDAFEHHVEGVQLLVTAGELRWALAGAGRIRVANGVHDARVWGSLRFP